MSNLLREAQRHLSDDVIMQLSRQIGAQDPNQVKKAAFVIAELLLDAIARNANNGISHLLGKQQIEAAQVISQHSGLNFFKSGVLMQLIAPVIMGVVGQTKKSSGFDLGGLAKVLMGGAQQQQQSGSVVGGVMEKLLDRDGDGSMMDDLFNIGMNILKK